MFATVFERLSKIFHGAAAELAEDLARSVSSLRGWSVGLRDLLL